MLLTWRSLPSGWGVGGVCSLHTATHVNPIVMRGCNRGIKKVSGKQWKKLGENKVSVLFPNRVLHTWGNQADFAEKLSEVGRGSRERIEGVLGRGKSTRQDLEAWECIRELTSRSGDGKRGTLRA